MNNQDNQSNLWIRDHCQPSLKPDPDTQSTTFLTFKAALLEAGTTTQERKANASAVRAARAEAKSDLSTLLSAEFQKVYTPEVAAAAARKEALKVVNRWSLLVNEEADNAKGSALGMPATDALEALLGAKPCGTACSQKFDIEMCCIHRYTISVYAPNVEEAHVFARKSWLPPVTLAPGFVTRTVGVNGQPVSLIHEDLSRMSIDHLTGNLLYWRDDYAADYDDGD